MRTLVQVGALGLCWSLWLCASGAAAQAWPSLKYPEAARVQTVAEDVVLNGVPAQVTRFDVRGTEADVIEFFRKQFGERRVENKVAGSFVMATQQANFFYTIQLKTTQPGQVQGTVMTNRVQGGGGRSAIALDSEKLLPAASAVLSQLQSNDAGKQSMLLMAANKASAKANRDHLVNALQERGFRLVKDDERAVEGRAAYALTLSSVDEEAMVTVTDAGAYRAVLINRTRDAK